MKISAVLTAVALACAGSAFAANLPDVPANNDMQQANPKAAKNFHDLAQKTKRGMHKMGAKARHAMHRDRTASFSHANNTAAMGASSDATSARQRRMDEAYAHWQAKQAKR